MKINFFTIVLNGMPFIKYHLDVLLNIKYDWHWHIIEGVADLKNDTSWSIRNGAKINSTLHNDGLSNDGTTEYIDHLFNKFPNNITVYRKPKGQLWNGKLEMVNAPIYNITEECILWEIDVDEFWTTEQINKVYDIFEANIQITAAMFLCYFFVGKNKYISSLNTYGNHLDYEWLRVWKYKPGDYWITHEPPVLIRKEKNEIMDVGKIMSIKHEVTLKEKLVFQHFAYVIPQQLVFKESYYGYKNALLQWEKLQTINNFPIKLSDYFEWVKDGAIVDNFSNLEIENLYEGFLNKQNIDLSNILYIRTDSIGDNIISMGIIEALITNNSNIRIDIICQDHIVELYSNIKNIKNIFSYNKQNIYNENYLKEFINHFKIKHYSTVLVPLYSREFITDYFAFQANSNLKIALRGNAINQEFSTYNSNLRIYDLLIENKKNDKNEIDYNSNFLENLGINVQKYEPFIYLSQENFNYAEEIFRKYKLIKEKTIIVFPYGQFNSKEYRNINIIIDNFIEEFDIIILGGKESIEKTNSLVKETTRNIINLVGKTTILEMASLIHYSKFLFSIDSSATHIAAALGKKNYILYSGGDFGRFLPYSPHTTVFIVPMECYNCRWNCKYTTYKCIEDLNPHKIAEFIFDDLSANKNLSEKPHIVFNTQEEINEEFINKYNLENYINIERIKFSTI